MKKQSVKNIVSFILILCMLMCSSAFVAQGATVKISKSKISLYVGQTKKLKLKGTSKKVKWSSSNKKVATVTQKGVVKAEAEGVANIYAKVGNKKYTCKVTVSKALTSNTNKLQFDTLNSEQNVSFTLNAVGTLTFKIKDPSIVSCSWGKWKNDKIKLYVKGLKNGTTKITVKNSFNSEKVVIKVTVHEPTLEEIKAQKEASIKISVENELPSTVSNYRYNGSIEQTYMLQDISYNVSYSTVLNKFTVNLYFSGEKIYDYRGSSQSSYLKISWKLYKDDYVIDSGTVYTVDLAEGEKFKNEIATIYNLTESGEYKLKILSTN